jgi:hypothetical protein
MGVSSRIDNTLNMTPDKWVISLVCSKGVPGHLVSVFEGQEPNTMKRWLWACDFVPAKFRFNGAHKRDNTQNCSYITLENICGTAGLVRTTNPFRERKKYKDFTLGKHHFSETSEYSYRSWKISANIAMKVQQEINTEEKNPPIYATGGKISFNSNGFNCSTWAIEKLKKCLPKEAKAELNISHLKQIVP